MFAIAFDLTVADTQENHPRGIAQAYSEIRTTLSQHGFDWGSLYVRSDENLAELFKWIAALKTLYWLPASVRDIRAFRVEQRSGFTTLLKG